MATIALFASLAGVSYAAISLPKDSVGSAELRRNSVGKPELKKRAVAAKNLRRGSVRPKALAVALGGKYTIEDRFQVLSAPNPMAPPLPVEIARANVAAREPGILLVFVLVDMGNVSPPGDDASVTVSGELDGEPMRGTTSVTAPARQGVAVPLQSTAEVDSGNHEIQINLAAHNYSGELRITSVTISSVLLPPS